MAALSNIVVAVLILALLLRRQLQPRAIREDRPFRFMFVLAAVGLWQVVQYSDRVQVSAAAWGLLVLSFVVGAALGLVRGRLIHVWRQEGVLMRQGNRMTVSLWVVALLLHIGVDLLIGQTSAAADQLGAVSILLYLAIALGAQRLATLQKAERLPDDRDLAR